MTLLRELGETETTFRMRVERLYDATTVAGALSYMRDGQVARAAQYIVDRVLAERAPL